MVAPPISRIALGAEAPDFTLPATGEAAGKGGKPRPVRLSDYRGRKNVVLAFFPGSFSPVCSIQMPSYEEEIAAFQQRDAQILGISVDNPDVLEAWARSLGGLSYPLLSDFWPHGGVALRYGVLRGEGKAERAIFVVDKAGVIRHIDVHDIDEPPPLPTILAALDRLR